MECLYTEQIPVGPEWTYEVKLDGYRAQAIRVGSNVQLLSRNSQDLGARSPSTVRALALALTENSATDGELVALDPGGRPSFSLLQNAGNMLYAGAE